MPPRLTRSSALLLKSRALDASPDAVVIGRLDGRVLMVNAAAARMLGCTARIAPRLRFPWFRDRDLQMRSRRFAGDRGQRAEVVHRTIEARRADGTRFRASIAFSLLGRGRCAAVAAHIRDQSTEGMRDQARGGDVMLHATSGFPGPETHMARIGHDLSNPLAIVVAQATVLHDLAPDPDIARRAERIIAAAHRAGRIVESLSMMAPRRPLELSTTKANAAVLDALASMSRGMDALGITVQRDLAPDLPDILADRALLARAIGDVCSQAGGVAARLAGERTVTIRTSIVGTDLAIDVTGAAPGPGLAVSQAIIADHGGKVADLDEPGGGGAVRITIPLAEAVPDAQRRSILSVLIVDDEADVAEALADVVRLLGHEAVVMASAEAALDEARGCRFDAAIVDLHMPGVDGLTLRGTLASVDPRLAGRIAIVTGDGTSRAAGGLAETFPTLQKPFTLSDVRALLLRLASR